MPVIIDASSRLERITDLREMLKYERAHLLEAVVDDPLSPETHVFSVSVQAMEREIFELERGIVRETVGA